MMQYIYISVDSSLSFSKYIHGLRIHVHRLAYVDVNDGARSFQETSAQYPPATLQGNHFFFTQVMDQFLNYRNFMICR